MGLIVKKYPKGPLEENTYLIKDEATGYMAVVDPGYFGEEIIKDIAHDDKLGFVILTHAHFDHFYSAEKYLKNYPRCVLVAPKKEEYLMSKDWSTDELASGFHKPYCPQPDYLVEDGDNIELGETALSIIETPGHTEGSICILSDGKLFSGDTLFRFSVGNTSFETGNWDDLASSIEDKLYKLDDDIVVYPGHGPETTIGEEKTGNPFV